FQVLPRIGLAFATAALFCFVSLDAYAYLDPSGPKGSPSPSPSPSCSPGPSSTPSCSCSPGPSPSPSSSCSSGNTTNPIKVFTGTVNREIVDLEMWGGVGEHQLQFKRFGNSRTETGASFRTRFGTAHSWSHNYEYLMTDEGLNDLGQPQLEITFPDGTT